MKVLVDTSVWSLVMRRDVPSVHSAVDFLDEAVEREEIVTTGLILQELLQGFHGPRARREILERFATVPLIVPQREDHIVAADLRNECRRHGVQIDTVDALLAQLCITHDLVMLTNDNDFTHLARYAPLKLWPGSTPRTPP